MFEPPKNIKPPKIQTQATNDWLNGVVTALDNGRTPIGGLRATENTILEQDGVISDRPSLVLWGPQPVGKVLGEVYQYRSVVGLTTTNRLISMQRVERDGKMVGRIFTALPEDTAWTEVTSPTVSDYDPNARAHFSQLANKVIITNGENELSYYDIDNNEIVQFQALEDPAAPTGTANNLTGSSFNVYYAVTANSSIGETTGSQVKVTVGKMRELWKDDGTENVKIDWTTVAGVKSWNVYCAVTADGDDIPKWGLIASGIAADTLTFTDTGVNGTGALNFYKPLPTSNSTAGPKASRSTVINGRVWLTGDKNNPYYVWHGGDFEHELDFTPANGGGFVNIGGGTREIPNKVWNFRTGPGEPVIKVATRGVNGDGKRYSLTNSTLTFGNNSFVVWAATEDYGSSGTDSPDALIVYGNNTYYPSRDNFKTIGTKPQLQNLLSIDGIADTILTDLDFLNQEAMDGAVGVGFENRLYFALPVGTDYNNQIWVLDLQRQGAWMKPWGIEADWIAVIADNVGKSHLVVVKDDMMYELSRATRTNDNGVAFPTSGTSGDIYFSESGQDWARLIKVIITVLRPRGEINFSVDGYISRGGGRGEVRRLGSKTLSETRMSTTASGWGEDGWGTAGWSYPLEAPDITSIASRDVEIKVNKDVKYWSWNWNTTGKNVSYSISKVVPVSVSIGIKNQ